MSNPVSKILAITVLSTVCLLAGRVSAENVTAGNVTAENPATENLTGEEIAELIGGEKVHLKMSLGITLPLHYRDDGVVVGDVSGSPLARMFAPKEEGRWWVEDNSLCQQWPTWYKGRQTCFTIKSLGEGKIAWLRDDGTSGTARLAD